MKVPTRISSISAALALLLLTSFRPVSVRVDAVEKSGLVMDTCAFAPKADAMILRDEGEWTVNSDLSFTLERQVILKFFKESKADRQLSDIIFYPCPVFSKYDRLSATVVDMDTVSKNIIHADPNTKITSIDLEHSPLRLKAGTLLTVHYFVTFSYKDKLPDWRFQSAYPTEFSSIRTVMPQMANLHESLESSYEAEVQKNSQSEEPMRIEGRHQNVKISQHYYQLNRIPAYVPEPFSDNSAMQVARLHIILKSILKDGKIVNNMRQEQEREIVESMTRRPDFMLRLYGPLDIRNDYDRLIRSLTDREVRLARIYDLVRRHIKWNGKDSIYAPSPLAKVWADKYGNSTEVNLALVKLLQNYGYEADPLLVSTRSHGAIDTEALSIYDFNRTVCCVRLNDKTIILDATAHGYDYPMVAPEILNTQGLLISMDPNRLIEVRDNNVTYKNAITQLGQLVNDSYFLTNIYINSRGYAKAEHLNILEKDSLKGLRRSIEKGYTDLQMKHFIVANEYIDTLPLAQEFDVKLRVRRNNNLRSVEMGSFLLPDTLLAIQDDRKTGLNFGYKQEYSVTSEYAYPFVYDVYLTPSNMQISALDGAVRFSRRYHYTGTSFSLKESLVINKTEFTTDEAIELARFLRRVNNLNKQEVILKKNGGV